jgi:hypothetical protein
MVSDEGTSSLGSLFLTCCFAIAVIFCTAQFKENAISFAENIYPPAFLRYTVLLLSNIKLHVFRFTRASLMSIPLLLFGEICISAIIVVLLKIFGVFVAIVASSVANLQRMS